VSDVLVQVVNNDDDDDDDLLHYFFFTFVHRGYSPCGTPYATPLEKRKFLDEMFLLVHNVYVKLCFYEFYLSPNFYLL
jgi:hypothetical protein